MIDTLIAALAKAEAPDDAYNPYAQADGEKGTRNAIRRANLRRYLQQMAEYRPPILLVMEAPGYRGMRLTGVPVTSRKLLREGVAEIGLFGVQRGYQDVDEPGFERVQGEQSATIVWGTLAALAKDGQPPAMVWNAYPFHPHKPDLPLTNRLPRRAEVAHGAIFLRMMLDLYAAHIKQVVAVGNVGDASLTELGIDHQKVRHPAQGGKNAFVAGMTALF